MADVSQDLMQATPAPTTEQDSSLGLKPDATGMGLQAPQEFGFAPTAEVESYGFEDTAPRAPDVMPTKSASLAAQHALVGGTTVEDVTSQMERQGPTAVLDTMYKQVIEQQQKYLMGAGNTAAASGDADTVMAVAEQLKRNADELVVSQATMEEKHHALADVAAAKVAAPEIDKNFRSDEEAHAAIDATAKRKAVANILLQRHAQAVKDMEQESAGREWGSIDNILHIGRELSYGPAMDTWQTIRKMRSFTEGFGAFHNLNSLGVANQLRTIFGNANSKQQAQMLAELDTLSPQQRELAYRWLSEGVSELQAVGQVAGDVADLLTPFEAAQLARWTIRHASRAITKGENVVATRELAGNRAAADQTVDTLNGGETSGQSAHEAVESSTAIGKNPGIVNEASLAGASPHVQATLRASGQNLWSRLADRFRISGLTDDEAAREMNRIEQTWNPSNDRGLHSATVVHGEQGSRVAPVYQRPDGTLFASREEAEAYARANGIDVQDITQERGVVGARYAEEVEAVASEVQKVPGKPHLKGPPAVARDVEPRGSAGERLAMKDEARAAAARNEAAAAQAAGDTARAEDLLAQAARHDEMAAGWRRNFDPNTAPSTAPATHPTLPTELQGAKPKYKRTDLTFESDLDKAAYIIAQSRKSKADAAYLKFVMDQTGLSEDGARAYGRQVAEQIKGMHKGGEAGLRVPALSAAEELEQRSLRTSADRVTAESLAGVKMDSIAGEQGVKADSLARARKEIAEGTDRPVEITLDAVGGPRVTDGRHLLTAAREAGAEVRVRVLVGDDVLEGTDAVRALRERGLAADALEKRAVSGRIAEGRYDADGIEQLEEDLLAKRAEIDSDLQSAYDPADVDRLKAQSRALTQANTALAKGDWFTAEDLLGRLGIQVPEHGKGPAVRMSKSELAQAEASRKATEAARAAKVAEVEKALAKTDLAFGKGIDPKVQQMLRGLKRIMGIKGKMYIGSAEDLGVLRKGWDVNNPPKNIGGWFSSSGTHNPYSFNYIALVDSGANEQGRLITALHEWGHFYEFDVLHRPENAAIFRQIQDAWLAELPKGLHPDAPGGPTTISSEQLHDYLAQFHDAGLQVMEDVATGARQFDPAALNPAAIAWARKFSEWYTEQLLKAAMREGAPRTIIETFFKSVVDQLREMYAMAKEFMGGSAEGARLFKKFDDVNPLVLQQLREQLARTKAKGKAMEKAMPLFPEGEGPRLAELDQLRMDGPSEAGPEGWVIRGRPVDIAYQTSAVGEHAASEIASMPRLAIDPKHAASTMAVEDRMIAVHAEDKMRAALADHLNRGWKPLSRGEKKRVTNILREGDAYSDVNGQVGKEFTASELIARGLNEKEQIAYFTVRQARDAMHRVHDGEMVRRLQAAGHMELGFSVVEDGVGRTLRTPGRVVDAASGINKTVWHAGEGRAVRMSEARVTQMGEAGEQLHQLHSPIEINGNTYQHVIGGPSSVRQAHITSVLPYRPGEFARIYTHEYFCTVTRNGFVDGLEAASESVIRTASSLKQAQAYAKSMNAAVEYMNGIRDGSIVARNPEVRLGQLIGEHSDVAKFIEQHAAGQFDGVTFGQKFTRTKEEYLNLFTGQALSEKPFTGVRGSKIQPITHGQQNTLDVMDAIQAEVSHVSRVANIGAWRETNIQRWMNSFGDLILDRTGDDVADFYRLANQKDFQFVNRGTREIFAERQLRYLRDQLGIQTKEERAYVNFARELSEKVFGSVDNEGINWIGAQIRQAHPINFLRSVNYNFQLGCFNMGQLFVQAAGMMNASLIHPIYGLVSAKTYPLLRLALMSDRPDVWKVVGGLNSLTEMGLSSIEDFQNLVRAVRKTGIIDNLRSTALHNLEDGKLGVTTGIGGRLMAVGRWPFNRGEEASRLISFDIARREWMGKNPGVNWMDDSALKAILIRMDDFTQNMTSANRAMWQKGLASIPTQFMQYNFKLASNVLTSTATGVKRVGQLARGEQRTPYRGFTARESATILGGHLVMLGAAGYGAQQFMAEILGDKLVNMMTPEQKAYATQGVISGLIASLTSDENGENGTHIAVGSRLSSFSFWSQLADTLFSEHTSLWDLVLGPTKSTGKRFAAAADTIDLWKVGKLDTQEALVEAVGKIGVAQIAQLRNATKAYLYFNQQGGIMTNDKGEPIASVNAAESVAIALGFQPSQAIDYYTMLTDRKQKTDALKEIGALIFKKQQEIVYATQRKDYAKVADCKKAIDFLWPQNAGDRHEVVTHIKKNLYPKDTAFQQLLQKYLEDGYREGVGMFTETPVINQPQGPLLTTSKPGSYPSRPAGESYGKQ